MPKPMSEETRRKLSEAGRKGAAARMRARKPTANKADKPGFHSARPMARLIKGRTDWYEIKDAIGDTTDVYIYDEIGYWGVTATSFVGELRAIATPNIDLHMNTPGGDVFDGLAIYNALIKHNATVNVYIDGIAASAGSFIAMAGDNIYIARNAMMMIHDAMGLCIGNARDMEIMMGLLDQHSDNIADIYAQRGGGTKEEFRALMKDETWFSADEAVEAGLADEVFNSRGGDDDDSEDPEDLFDLSVFTYAGRSEAPDPQIPENKATDPVADKTSDEDDEFFAALGKSLKEALA